MDLLGVFDRLFSVLSALATGRLELRIVSLIRNLLRDSEYTKRRFETIRDAIGLDHYSKHPDELRKLILIAGGVRYTDSNGQELWGLPKRNKHEKTARSGSRSGAKLPLLIAVVLATVFLVRVWVGSSPCSADFASMSSQELSEFSVEDLKKCGVL